MADFKNILAFVLVLIWRSEKVKILFLALSWIIYLINFREYSREFFCISVFVWNLIISYSLLRFDRYLIHNGFYSFYCISRRKLSSVKVMIICGLLALHIIVMAFQI